MTGKMINLQDSILNNVRKEGIVVGIHLVNGFQIKGLVKGFDNFTVILDSMGKQQLIYKHAISTITMSRPVNTTDRRNDDSAVTPVVDNSLDTSANDLL